MLKNAPLIESDVYRANGAYRGSEGEGQQTEPVLDMRFLFGVLRRRSWLVVLGVLIAAVLALGVFAITPPAYEASSRVVLDSPRLDPFGDNAIFTGMGQDNPEIESQIQIIRSEYMLAQVVEGLQLQERPSLMDNYRSPFRDWLEAQIDGLRDAVFGPATDAEQEMEIAAARAQEAVDKIRDGLTVMRVGLTYVLNISYTSSSAQLSADVANGVAETYIQERMNSRQGSAIEASHWFTEQVSELNRQALEAERRVAEYRADNGMFDAGNEGQLNEQQLASLNDQLTNAIQQSEASRARMALLETIVTRGNFTQPLPSNLTSVALDAMFEQRQKLAIDRLRFELRSGVDHPATLDITAQISGMDSQIEAEIRNIHAQAVTEFEAAQSQMQATQERYDQAIGAAQHMNQSQVELQALESEAKVYRALHDEYLQSQLQTIQQQSFPSAEARIIQMAVPPDFISSPRLSWMVLIGGSVGLAAGVGLAFLAEFRDRRIRSRAQLAAATHLQNLGILPKSSGDPKPLRGSHLNFAVPSKRHQSEVSYHQLPAPATGLAPAAFMTRTIDDPVSPYAETLRRTRVVIDKQTSGGGHVVAFVSDVASASRSVAAVNYAEMLALGGARTLLVDLDWRRSFLSEALAPNASAGLTDYLASRQQTQSAELWTDDRTGLQFLPNRPLRNRAALDPSILDTEVLKVALQRLSSTFRHIVLDLSPLAESSDAGALAERIDAYVVVAAWGETLSDSLESELWRSAVPRDKLIGTILANVNSQELAKYE